MLEPWTTPLPGLLAAWTQPLLRGDSPVAYPATSAVQEDPVHPDLILVVYRQHERELTRRLEHRRSHAARGGTRPRRTGRTPLFAALASRRRRAPAAQV